MFLFFLYQGLLWGGLNKQKSFLSILPSFPFFIFCHFPFILLFSSFESALTPLSCLFFFFPTRSFNLHPKTWPMDSHHRPSPSPEVLSNDDSARAGTRKRTRTTLNQLRVLEETFTERPSPDSKLRKQLSDDLGMSERSIQIWFQNRRAKVKLLKKRAKMKEEQQASVKKATCSLPPSNKRPLVDKPMAQPNAQPLPPRSVAARMPFHRAWSYDMAKDMPPPVVYSPAAHALPPHWNYPYYPMAPPPPVGAAPPHHGYRSYPRPMYQQQQQQHHPDQQLTDGMASLAFSDMMQSQLQQQPQPLYHPPPTPTSYLLPISKPKQSFSLPPQTYRHGSQFSSSPTSDVTDESGRRYGELVCARRGQNLDCTLFKL